MSRTEKSQTESLEIRQAKATAVADYIEGEEREAESLRHDEVTTEVVNVIRDMSLYKEFKSVPEIDNALTQMDVHLTEEMPYTYEYGFDDSGELSQLQQQAQTALNKSIGTPSEPLARATLNTINRASHDVLAELAGEEDAENTRF